MNAKKRNSIFLVSLASVIAALLLTRKPKKQNKVKWDYNTLKNLIKDETLPAMILDADVLQENMNSYLKYNKPLRLSTKSIRVPKLIIDIVQRTEFGGRLMCFNAEEALYLSQIADFPLDILMAYPIVRRSELEHLIQIDNSHTVTLMIDSVEHARNLTKFLEKHDAESTFNVCIDVDMSLRFLGIHLGVWRSPIRLLENFTTLATQLQKFPRLNFTAVMGYEAQVAGLGDNNPFDIYLVRMIKHYIRVFSMIHVRNLREKISKWLHEKNIQLKIFNGGGSGSISMTAKEPWITDVTVGSGIVQSAMFDYFSEGHNKPALLFALNISRISEPGCVTCHCGGFIASGPPARDKEPTPILPKGIRAIEIEGYGEVQTPMRHGKEIKLEIGDPLFFRPAKAGEIAEHFSEYLIMKGDKIIDRWKTYRGEYRVFH